MGKFVFVIVFIFSSLSLHAYSKKIILSSFSTEDRASRMLKSLPERTPTIYALSKQYGFEFNVRKIGRYYILSAEVFKDKKTLLDVVKKIRKSFKGAYITDAVSAKEVKKIAANIIVESKLLVVEELSNEMMIVNPKPLEQNTTKKIEIKPEKAEEKSEEKSEEKVEPKIKEKILTIDKPKPEIKKAAVQKSESKPEVNYFDEYFHWSYIVFLILGGVMIHYFIKFKRIYDEY